MVALESKIRKFSSSATTLYSIFEVWVMIIQAGNLIKKVVTQTQIGTWSPTFPGFILCFFGCWFVCLFVCFCGGFFWGVFFVCFCFFAFQSQTHAYGSSQARDRIGATAARLCHSHRNAGSKTFCKLHLSSQQHQILNPLSKARITPAASWVVGGFVTHWATKGTTQFYTFSQFQNLLRGF